MKNLLTGLFLVFCVLTAAGMHAKAAPSTFINIEGIVVVIGGTLSVAILNSRFSDLTYLFKQFFKLLKTDDHKKGLSEKLVQVTQQVGKGSIPSQTGYEDLDRVLEWVGAGLKGKELEALLDGMVAMKVEKLYSSAAVLQNLSKYPPALGMIGTVIGIVSIFQGLGQESGQAMLGANLAVAMASTLYGLVLANFFINPVAELLTQSIQKKEEELHLIVSTAKLWAERENSFYIQEHVELFNVA